MTERRQAPGGRTRRTDVAVPPRPAAGQDPGSVGATLLAAGLEPRRDRVTALVRIASSGATRAQVQLQVSATGGGEGWQRIGARSLAIGGDARTGPTDVAVSWPVSLRHTWCFTSNETLVRVVLDDGPRAGTAAERTDPRPPRQADGAARDPEPGSALQVRIHPTTTGVVLADLVAELDDPLPKHLLEQLDLDQELALAEPTVLPLGELATAYLLIGIEPHRFAFRHLRAVTSRGGAAGTDDTGAGAESTTVAARRDTHGRDPAGDLVDADVDVPTALEALARTRSDTSYEEIAGIGYDPVEHALVAVVTTRQSHGYGGGPCTAGTTEYVTFWARSGGDERCLGTAEVRVHDHEASAGALEYAAVLPLGVRDDPDDVAGPGVDQHGAADPSDTQDDQDRAADPTRRPSMRRARAAGQAGESARPVEVEVRAVLSWEEPASTTDPRWAPTWGHTVTTRTLIPF